MSAPPALFTIEPKYCIDTKVIISFMHEDDGQPYRPDIFVAQWGRIETFTRSGEIIAPRRVEVELAKWEEQSLFSPVRAEFASHPASDGWPARLGGGTRGEHPL